MIKFIKSLMFSQKSYIIIIFIKSLIFGQRAWDNG